MVIRPRRSVLYMPGSNQRALDKARSLKADALILDLEDAVAPDAKVIAREQIAAAIAQGGYGQRELIVRVNGLDTEWGVEDLQVMAQSGADAICLPKVETAEQVKTAVKLLEEAGAPEALAVWTMAETPLGILNIAEVAAAHPRMEAIVMGTSDLAKELRVRHTPDRLGFIASLGMCVVAARAYGLDVLDGVHLDLNDEVGFRLSCEQGRDWGFDGKTLIHPKQLALANELFAPDSADLDRAQRMIDAWQQAEAEGKAVVLVDGKLVENLHVEEAKRQLAIAEAIAVLAVD